METSTAVIPHPQTGEVVDLATAPTESIAAVVDAIAQHEKQLKDLRTLGAIELTRRLDKGGSWTERVKIDDVPYEIKAASPTAGTESYDADELADELTVLVASDTITEDAAAKALQHAVTVTFACPSPTAADEVEAQAREDDRVTSVARSTNVAKSGVNALLKIPGAKEAVERCKRVADAKTAEERPAKVSVKA